MAIRDEQTRAQAEQTGQDAMIAQALGDPIRLTLLRALSSATGPLSLSELAANSDIESTMLIDHLAALASLGAIVRTDDVEATYRLARTPLARTLSAMVRAMPSATDSSPTAPAPTFPLVLGGVLDTILDQTPIGVALYDARGHLIHLNTAGERITQRHAIRGETHGDRLRRYEMRQPDGVTMPLEASPSGRALRGEVVAEVECIIDGQHGHDTWLRCSAAPLRDDDGTLHGAAVIFEDITDQVILRHEEAHQRALAATMIENTFSGMAVFDVSDAFRCVQHNDNFLHLLGPDYQARGTVVGMSLADLFEGETLARVRQIYEQVRTTGEPFFINEFSASVPPNQGHRWYRWRLTAVRDEHGKIVGLLNVAFEITELVNMRETSRRRMKELETIIAAMPEAVMLADNAGRFILGNAAAETVLGHPVPAHAPVDHFDEVFHTFASDGHRLDVQQLPLVRALRGETVVSEEVIYERLNGRRVDLLISSAPVHFDDSGQIAGAVAVFQDITRIKELERQRDDFLGIAAHELRTPLATILVTLQAFLRRLQNHPEDQAISAEALLSGMERMHRQAQRLNKLVTDLLDTTRIRTGALVYDMVPCDLNDVVRDAVAGQIAANPGRTILLAAPEHPVMVTGDAFRLSQVVDNLTANALKYSRNDAPVTVSLKAQGQLAVLRVTDKGVGIALDNIEHLFSLYYRVPGVDVQSGAGVGLGLGLHITRSVVERHNGRIKVRSTPGKGSTFVVTLPLQEPTGQQDQREADQREM